MGGEGRGGEGRGGEGVEARRKRGDLQETHKIMHGLERIREETFFARADTLQRGTARSYSRKDRDENHAGTASRNEWSFHGMHCLRR